jgi:hypothetical protein
LGHTSKTDKEQNEAEYGQTPWADFLAFSVQGNSGNKQNNPSEYE